MGIKYLLSANFISEYLFSCRFRNPRFREDKFIARNLPAAAKTVAAPLCRNFPPPPIFPRPASPPNSRPPPPSFPRRRESKMLTLGLMLNPGGMLTLGGGLSGNTVPFRPHFGFPPTRE
ncbi:MAG: hypothetical protein HAW59_00465 [Betaproteobacteria bacterium]|nr:hypothetical protein [Betaproteobacteria bacterium]